MNIRGTPDLGQPSDDPSSGGQRERIRQRMKMVIGQLEGILQELKEVAKELREVSEGPARPQASFPGPGTKTCSSVFKCVCVLTAVCTCVTLLGTSFSFFFRQICFARNLTILQDWRGLSVAELGNVLWARGLWLALQAAKVTNID